MPAIIIAMKKMDMHEKECLVMQSKQDKYTMDPGPQIHLSNNDKNFGQKWFLNKIKKYFRKKKLFFRKNLEKIKFRKNLFLKKFETNFWKKILKIFFSTSSNYT